MFVHAPGNGGGAHAGSVACSAFLSAAAHAGDAGSGAAWVQFAPPWPSMPVKGPHGGSSTHTWIIGACRGTCRPGGRRRSRGRPRVCRRPSRGSGGRATTVSSPPTSGAVSIVVPGSAMYIADSTVLVPSGCTCSTNDSMCAGVEHAAVAHVRTVHEVLEATGPSAVADPRVAGGDDRRLVGERGHGARAVEQARRTGALSAREPRVVERDDRSLGRPPVAACASWSAAALGVVVSVVAVVSAASLDVPRRDGGRRRRASASPPWRGQRGRRPGSRPRRAPARRAAAADRARRRRRWPHPRRAGDRGTGGGGGAERRRRRGPGCRPTRRRRAVRTARPCAQRPHRDAGAVEHSPPATTERRGARDREGGPADLGGGAQREHPRELRVVAVGAGRRRVHEPGADRGDGADDQRRGQATGDGPIHGAQGTAVVQLLSRDVKERPSPQAATRQRADRPARRRARPCPPCARPPRPARRTAASARRTRSRRARTRPSPSARPPITSLSQCTPSSTRDVATATARKTARAREPRVRARGATDPGRARARGRRSTRPRRPSARSGTTGPSDAAPRVDRRAAPGRAGP